MSRCATAGPVLLAVGLAIANCQGPRPVHADEPARPPVTAIACSPDGRHVLIASQRGIESLGAERLEPRKSLATELPHVHDLEFSPDGKWLLAAGGAPGEYGAVELYGWPSGELAKRFRSHEDLVYAVAWCDDSQAFATASADRSATLHDVHERMPSRRLTGHSRSVLAVAFMPGGQQLITAGVDETLRLWDIDEGRIARQLANHSRPVHDLAIRPGRDRPGPPMLVSVSDDRTVRLWQPTVGRLVRFARLDAVPLAVDWTADGQSIVVACRDGCVRRFDPDTMELTAEISAIDGIAYSLARAPDGSWLIGGQRGQFKRITLPPVEP